MMGSRAQATLEGNLLDFAEYAYEHGNPSAGYQCITPDSRGNRIINALLLILLDLRVKFKTYNRGRYAYAGTKQKPNTCPNANRWRDCDNLKCSKARYCVETELVQSF